MNEKKPGISPEEIRAIRTDLGLSQVEAGKLLGGGPRAFTKYEAGAVKPAASVVTLLRLLEANPDMINVLRGDRPRPRGDRPRPIAPTAGTGPFEVAGEHIEVLNERWFPCLLRRLLSAEAFANNLPADAIHVAGNITAPDGGEDGRIAWTGGPDRTAFLPSRLVQFQLKAGKILPTAAGRELLTKEGEVKDMVRSVLEAGGHYVMLSTHPFARKSIEARKTRIRETLRGAGITVDDDQVHFRDADQIATWVNRHPSVAIWVKEQTQPGTIGPFRSWFHWANRAEHHSSPWVEDDRLPELRTRLRERVTEPRGIARVVGLSGVGKSRLILEAFGPAGEKEDRLLGDLVLYADVSETDPAAINRIVQSLADMGTPAVVVVDSCGPDTHRVLAGMVSRPGSRLSLVTIDDEIPSGTLDKTTFKVGEAPSSVIETVIDQVSPGLPSEDRRRLVHFSKGFPKIAIRIGQKWAESVPVAHATADDLADAFVLGRSPRESEQLLRKSAALLATFGLVGVDLPADGGADDELCEIAARGRDLVAADLRAAVRELGDRDVIQRRGRFAVLQPRPIAMRLAERQWREWNRNEWDDVLAGDAASLRLRIMAAKQLTLLNTTPISKKVVIHVCRPGGPFDSFEGGGPEAVHAEVLSFLAEIDSEVVATWIERCLDDVGDLSEIQGGTRRHLVWALEKIAFHPGTFEDGARLLLRLAVAENERSISNNATGQFKTLFPVLLGNTAADGSARLSILDEAAETDDPIQRSIVVEALICGSTTDHFSRAVGAETHGSRPALESWHPATNAAMVDYIEGCVTRLARFAEQGDESGIAARAGLGGQLRSLISTGFLDTVERVVHQVDGGTGRWTMAMESLGHFLEYDATDADYEVIVRVRALITKLKPKSLKSRVRFLVTEMPWDFPCGEKLDLEICERRQVEAVRTLAAEIAEQPEVLKGVLPQLSRDEQRMAHIFGEAVADSIGPGDSSADWLDRIVLAVTQTPENERNFNLLSGYVTSLAKHHPDIVEAFKQKAAQSPQLATVLPLICWRLGIRPSDIGLAIGALQTGLLPVWCLRQWTRGGVLAEVPASEVATLFDTMLDHSAEAFTVAVELMWMYAHGTPDRLDGFRPHIRKAAENVARWRRLRGNVMADYHFENIMKWMLGKGRQDPDAQATALALATALVSTTDWDEGRIMKSVVSTLLSNFPEITWPLIGQAVISDRAQSWRLRYVFLGDPFSFKQEKNPAMLSLPEDTLFAWCRAHPDQAPAFVARVIPILTIYRNDASAQSLHPVMRRLIDEFGDRDDVRQAVSLNMGNFSWSGSVTNYFTLYLEPLRTLCAHPKWQVRRWAKAMLRHLDARIEHARNQDEERDAEWDI